jgi:hypothetical protein
VSVMRMHQLNLVSGALLWCVHLDKISSTTLFNIDIYSEKFTVVSIKIEYSISRRVAYRVFFKNMSCRFVLRLGSGISI